MHLGQERCAALTQATKAPAVMLVRMSWVLVAKEPGDKENIFPTGTAGQWFLTQGGAAISLLGVFPGPTRNALRRDLTPQLSLPWARCWSCDHLRSLA